jgi:hypothetical protein
VRAEATAQTFKAQDVANSVWSYATLGLEPPEPLLNALEVKAVEIMNGFNAQNIANTLWAFAAWERRPGAQLLRALCARAEDVAHTFSAQNIANTLRGLTIMASPPGDRLLGALARRAAEVESEFKPYELVSVLWSSCFLCIDAPGLTCRLVSGLEEAVGRLCDVGEMDAASLSQLHMYLLACQLEEGLAACMQSSSVLAVREKMGSTARAAFAGQGTRPSHTQHQVSLALRSMHFCVHDEFRCPQSGLTLDLVVSLDPRAGEDTELSLDSRAGERMPGRWAVEVDGPRHFLACRSPTGATVIKRRLVRLLGFSLVSIPFWEWDSLQGLGQQAEYLSAQLQQASTS